MLGPSCSCPTLAGLCDASHVAAVVIQLLFLIIDKIIIFNNLAFIWMCNNRPFKSVKSTKILEQTLIYCEGDMATGHCIKLAKITP